jgi:hypothetical protein
MEALAMTGWEIEYAHEAALAEDQERSGHVVGWRRGRAQRLARVRSAQEKQELAFIQRLDQANAERIQALIDNGVDPAIICHDCGMVHSRKNRGTGLEELMKEIHR